MHTPRSASHEVRSRLFVKYVALFVGVVTLALLANGASQIWFFSQEHRASLIRIQHEQAEAAAAKIDQFLGQIDPSSAGRCTCPGRRACFRSVRPTPGASFAKSPPSWS